MRSPIVFALAAVGPLVGLALWGALRPPRAVPPARAEPTGGDDESSSPPGLAAPPSSARAPSATPPPVGPTTSSSTPAPRRLVRARLVAVDVTTGRALRATSSFDFGFGPGCDLQTWERHDGVEDVTARLPPGADATELAVAIEEWGFRPVRRKFPLPARDVDLPDELRVPVEPVDDAAWRTIGVVLGGDGDRVGERESLDLSISPRTWNWGRPHHGVSFEIGARRAQDVRVPYPADELEFASAPRVRAEGGRRVWIGPRLLRVDRTSGNGSMPATVTVVREPAASLELEFRYPEGDRPPSVTLLGSFHSERIAREDGGWSGYATTFNAHPQGAPDVARIEYPVGQLTSLSTNAPGFEASMDPPPPYELRLAETLRIGIELRRPPPKTNGVK